MGVLIYNGKQIAISNITLDQFNGTLTALPEDILQGKTAYDGQKIVQGIMPKNDSIEIVLSDVNTYTIPEGYHTGTGKIVFENKKGGNATSADILENKTAYVNGIEIKGTMKNNGAIIFKPTNLYEPIKIPAGYHNGEGFLDPTYLRELTQENIFNNTKISNNIVESDKIGDYYTSHLDGETSTITRSYTPKKDELILVYGFMGTQRNFSSQGKFSHSYGDNDLVKVLKNNATKEGTGDNKGFGAIEYMAIVRAKAGSTQTLSQKPGDGNKFPYYEHRIMHFIVLDSEEEKVEEETV